MKFSARLVFIGLCLLLGSLLSSCVTLHDPETAQEYRADIVATVDERGFVGQEMVSRRPRLNTIQLWLAPQPGAATDAVLNLALYAGRGETAPIVSRSFAISSLGANPLTFTFTPLADQPERMYYLVLRASGGAVQALGRSEDAYPQGSAYWNDQPLPGDLSFRLSYAYGPAAILADIRQALSGWWLSLPLLAILWLPGRLLLTIARLDRHFDWGERIALSIGLSMAVIPLGMMWTTLAGLQWTRLAVLVVLALAGAAFAWGQRREIRRFSLHSFLARPGLIAALGLGLVFLFTLGLRLAMVRDLAAPAWVDSVHHAMIARLIAEQGAFPHSYAPYLEVDTASYHAGFHSLLTLFHWLSGLEIDRAMLLFGQVLNALMVFSVYAFTTLLTRDRLAGGLAALVTGAFTPMPAYYASWGRYTQLAGLLILPPAAILITGLWRHARRHGWSLAWRKPTRQGYAWLLLAAVACAGLFLTHYRVIAFLACLLVSLLAAQLLRALLRRRFWLQTRTSLGLLAATGMLAIALTLPWWPATLATLFVPKFSASQVPVAAFSDFSWGFLTTAFGQNTMIVAGIGLAWAILTRRALALIIPLWVGLLFLLANPGALGLPGVGFVNNVSVEIMLFIPISALTGYLVSWLVTAWDRVLPALVRPFYRAGVLVAGVTLTLFAARALLPILNPVTFLFRAADRPAMAWIAAHVPPEEAVLINPFSWGYGLYAGSDGGYWITPLAGRKSMPPPALYGLEEQSENVAYVAEISRQVTEKGRNATELYAYLRSIGIEYVYSGGRGGPLSPQALVESPLFDVRFAQDGVWVFQLVPESVLP